MGNRVANSPIPVPSDVTVTNDSGGRITVKGKNGELTHTVHPDVRVVQQQDQLSISLVHDNSKNGAIAGTTRALLNNMVKGVSDGFSCTLVLKGVGYRAKAQGQQLNLTLGLSHPVDMQMPKDVTVETPSNTEIVLKGANWQLIKQVAANIRSIRPPEPYKGKGIRYKDEHIALKETKKK